MPRYGMTIDLNRCVGCQTCTVACKHANDTVPGVQWREVLDVETGRYPDVERLFLVTGCQHCAEPPCVPVCPTGATFQRDDGLVAMDYDLCIGCGYCAVACPYQARTIVHDPAWYFGTETRQERAVEHPERVGVAQKCTFCVEKVDDGRTAGLVPGVDWEATPACASSCIASAIRFGDLDDPGSEVSRLARERGLFRMHESLGTEPGIRYLYDTPAVPGREPGSDDVDDGHLADASNPLVGAPQTFWDLLRAAANFTLGGLASGFALAAWLGSLAGAVDPGALPGAFLAAAVVMALGLFAVFLEIGRKLRFANVLRRPQTSWMTREVYVVAVFYPAVAAVVLGAGPAASAIAGVAAAAFLYCQARILHAGRGIPAWRAPLLPWLIVATGLAEGTGLVAIMDWVSPFAVRDREPVAALGIALAAVNAALWWRYRATARERGVGPLARAVLAALSARLVVVGRVVPALLYASAFLAPGEAYALVPVAGLAAIAAGAMLKITLVTRACHRQGFALARLPQRGSGRRAAPRRLAPG